MSYYRTCPFCGVHLDPGEYCDCIDLNLPELVSNKKAADGKAIPPTATGKNRDNVIISHGKENTMFFDENIGCLNDELKNRISALSVSELDALEQGLIKILENRKAVI